MPPVAFASAFGGLQFTRPVKLVQHPADDDRWYVVEQGGKIWTFLASNPAGTKVLALDLVASQGVNLGSTLEEQGLLGLAFDPDFDGGGELYITYTDEAADDSILARYQSPDDDGPFVPTADPIVLSIPHPQPNHNAGDIMFGPDDFLYYSMGDGGGSNDPNNNGQNTSALLGKVLRLDVLGAPPMGEAYAIPGTNLFAGNAHCDGDGVGTSPCPEIFAWGLRNPWRMSFDMDTDELWLGDVGQSRREEIDQILSGRNYGWACNEGDLEGPKTGGACASLVSEPPEVALVRDDAEAITGGVVYRGDDLPDLFGFYVYGDYLTKKFFAFDADDANGLAGQLDLPGHAVSAFGQDRTGEVYAVTFDTPSIYKLVPGP